MRIPTCLVLALSLVSLTGCMVGADEDEDDLDPDVVIEEPVPNLSPEEIESVPPADERLVIAAYSNLLGNADFEQALDHVSDFENWSNAGNAHRETSAARSGSYGLRVAATTSSAYTGGQQVIRVAANRAYRISVDARVAQSGARHQRIYAMTYDKNGSPTNSVAEIVHTADYKWHTEKLIIVAPAGSEFLVIGLGKAWTCAERCGGGIAYYDNASVVQTL